MLTMYTIFCFSPFVPDVKTKFYLGYVTIFIVISHLAVNLFWIFKGTFSIIKLMIRNRFTRKLNIKVRIVL